MNKETHERNSAREDLLHMLAEGEKDLQQRNLLDVDSVFRALREEFFEAEK
ncbi:hypothetical protein [Sediminispirochaeta smaragdinae]|uniref:Uncharacterized protein n=1 Tax=Sediminispirochaeta smaragdinae (strain DSM 11293 / JCM 15392 / SEBR 4228) TaxID=573413 RepID=E1RAU0_SEDSS|nr:hypothetical protein [Sediminispirochaeta smaragdinae]ADK82458.1 hypothetical protein Spirs_3365 [Sediminispirochaeta smaragdinae DSM 11293]